MFFDRLKNKKNINKMSTFSADYAKLCANSPDQQTTASFELQEKYYIEHYLYLPNDILIGNARGALSINPSCIYAWDAKTGKILSAKPEPKHVVQLIQVTDDILAIAYYSGELVFHSYADPTKPHQLAAIKLPNEHEVSEGMHVVKTSDDCLVVVAGYRSEHLHSYHLAKINFDSKHIADDNVTITPIAVLPKYITEDMNNLDLIDAFDKDKVIIVGYHGLYLYSINKINNDPEKTITFPDRVDKPYLAPHPKIHVLNNGKVATVFTHSNHYFAFACWDLNQPKGQELLKIIYLPRDRYTRGIELLTEDNQNRVVMITDELLFEHRLFVIDLNTYSYEQYHIQNEELRYNALHCSFVNKGQQMLNIRDHSLKLFAIPNQVTHEIDSDKELRNSFI